MSEIISQTRIEDAIADTASFLSTERGAELDGGFASSQLEHRVITTHERAEALLQSSPHPTLHGLHVPLHKNAVVRYDEAVATLPGYMVLVPSALIEKGPSVFYPAVVSEDGVIHQQLRLHVLKQPYHQKITNHAHVALSAAGQAETKGIGEHGRATNDGVEAEHFATLLSAGVDEKVRANWQSGEHINHTWRSSSKSSVTGEMNKRLFGSEAPQTTLTLTRHDIEQGGYAVLA